MTQNNTNKITAAVPHKDEPSKEAQSSESPIESEAVNDSNDDLEIVEEERGVIPPNTVNAAKREEQSVESSSRTRRKSLIDSIKKPFVGMNRRPNREYAFVVGAGLWLALSAGFSNGVCMSGFLLNNHHHNHQEQQQPEGTAAPAVVVYSVAGVTGTCTRSAIFLAKGEFHKMGVDFGIILSVLLGSFLAGYMNPHSVAFELGPRLGPSFVIASGLMTIGAIFATLPLSISVRSNGTLEIYFTAMANGLQNGLISLYCKW